MKLQNPWHMIAVEIQNIILIVVTVFSFISFLIGMLIVQHPGDDCAYQSIASRVNIPYIIGCELARDRWPVE